MRADQWIGGESTPPACLGIESRQGSPTPESPRPARYGLEPDRRPPTPESPRSARGLRLAALLARFARCGAYVASLRERPSPFRSTRTATAPQPHASPADCGARSLRSLGRPSHDGVSRPRSAQHARQRAPGGWWQSGRARETRARGEERSPPRGRAPQSAGEGEAVYPGGLKGRTSVARR